MVCGVSVCVFLLNYSMSKLYCAEIDKDFCVSVCQGKQMTVLCAPVYVFAGMCAPLHSGGAVAGVARRTQRLFEIIRQLPALLGPDSHSSFLFCSLFSFLLVFSVRINQCGATVADSWERVIL